MIGKILPLSSTQNFSSFGPFHCWHTKSLKKHRIGFWSRLEAEFFWKVTWKDAILYLSSIVKYPTLLGLCFPCCDATCKGKISFAASILLCQPWLRSDDVSWLWAWEQADLLTSALALPSLMVSSGKIISDLNFHPNRNKYNWFDLPMTTNSSELVFFVSSVSLSFFVVVLFVTGKEKMVDITLKKFSVIIIITILWLKNLSVRETFLELRYLVVQRTCISLKWVLCHFYWKNNKSSKSFSTIHSSF